MIRIILMGVFAFFIMAMPAQAAPPGSAHIAYNVDFE